MLSGFVITHTYENRMDTKENFVNFIIKRFTRVWPLHVFITICYLPFVTLAYAMGDSSEILSGDRFSSLSFIANIFFLQSFGFFDSTSWNLPSWSIATEFFAYIFFGFLFVTRLREKFIFILIIFSSFMMLYLYSNMEDTNTFSVFRCFYSFFLGVFIYRCNLQRFFYTGSKVSSIFEFFAIFLVVVFLNSSGFYFAAPFVFSLVILVFSTESGLFSRILKLDFFQMLGMISFSIYMTHALVITYLKGVIVFVERLIGFSLFDYSFGVRVFDFKIGALNEISVFIFLISVVAVSKVTYNYVELFFQRKLNLFFNR